MILLTWDASDYQVFGYQLSIIQLKRQSGDSNPGKKIKNCFNFFCLLPFFKVIEAQLLTLYCNLSIIVLSQILQSWMLLIPMK